MRFKLRFSDARQVCAMQIVPLCINRCFLAALKLKDKKATCNSNNLIHFGLVLGSIVLLERRCAPFCFVFSIRFLFPLTNMRSAELNQCELILMKKKKR